MSECKIKSGKEIVDDFFRDIAALEGVDTKIANALSELYAQNKLTDKNAVNELQKMRV